ncbi:MAG: hypothetical protein Q8910_00260 [Bacteroidota bacterium]|nr:hypothetical protein [Bacteroidota bacterium]
MEAIQMKNAFTDQEVTCQCGNKHEFYGGKGYNDISCEGSEKLYTHTIQCKSCGLFHTYTDSETRGKQYLVRKSIY